MPASLSYIERVHCAICNKPSGSHSLPVPPPGAAGCLRCSEAAENLQPLLPDASLGGEAQAQALQVRGAAEDGGCHGLGAATRLSVMVSCGWLGEVLQNKTELK